MPQSYFNIMAKDIKRKAPVLGKYMFYHISIYGNGIEFFTFFQYQNDACINQLLNLNHYGMNIIIFIIFK
jgi:hypothetical protein